MNGPDDKEQRELLMAIKDGGGYGILFILKRPGDTLFAASPVPRLKGYEICCASPERMYDVWKDGTIEIPDQTRKQIREWIRTNTPEWLYDDSEVTADQQIQVKVWVDAFQRRYPRKIVVGMV